MDSTSKEYTECSIFNTKNSEYQGIQNVENPQPIPQTTSPQIKFSAEEAEEIIRKFQAYKPNRRKFKYDRLLQLENCKLKIYKDSYYFGQLVNGKKNGLGVILHNNGRSYEGQFENDRKHGLGFERFADSAIYEGMYINGKPEGIGKFLWANGESYEGNWMNGLKHGQGVWNGLKGDSYIGEWRIGNPDGYGVYVWCNGDRYEGEFHNSLKHGSGIEYLANGDIYKGQYANGKPEGMGEYQWSTGSYYNGQFLNGLRHGKGLWIKDRNATLTDQYEGDFVNDKRCGYGVFKWAKGNRYEGNFYDDLRHGFGKMFWSDGQYYSGMWEQGYQWGEGEYVRTVTNSSVKRVSNQNLESLKKIYLEVKNLQIINPFKLELNNIQVILIIQLASSKSVRANSLKGSIKSQQKPPQLRPSSVKSVSQRGCQGNNSFKSRRKPSLPKQLMEMNF